MAATLSAVAVRARWNELSSTGTIAKTSRYELERCAQALWVVIMADNKVADDLVRIYEQFKVELLLRTHGH